MPQGILVDYEWCTGCHSCEFACQYGARLPGGADGHPGERDPPWKIDEDVWQLAYMPVPTDQCDLCAARRELGKVPTCVQHCQAKCLEYGPLEELNAKLAVKTRSRPCSPWATEARAPHPGRMPGCGEAVGRARTATRPPAGQRHADGGSGCGCRRKWQLLEVIRRTLKTPRQERHQDGPANWDDRNCFPKQPFRSLRVRAVRSTNILQNLPRNSRNQVRGTGKRRPAPTRQSPF